MVTFKILGRVLPETRPLTVLFPNTITVDAEGGKFAFRTSIESGRVEVECFALIFNRDMMLRALRHVQLTVRALVNIHGFATGEAFAVRLEQIEEPNGVRTNLLQQNDELALLVTAYSPDVGMPEIWEIVLNDYTLTMMFNDLAMALDVPQYAPIACGRVLDAMRQHFIVVGDKEPKHSWQRMHEALRVDRPYQQWVSTFAAKPRHAEPTKYEREDIKKCLERTWALTNRFLEYRKRGVAALPDTEFPVLLD